MITGIPYLNEEYTVTFIRASASESSLMIMNVTINLTIDYIGYNVLLQDIYIHTYIHTLFIPEADDNYYIQIKLKRKYF